MGTPQEFYNYAINKVFNNKGQIMNINYVQGEEPYGGQCVSLIQGLMAWGGKPCVARGHAKDWWFNRASNGVLSYFDVVTGAPQNGDVGVSVGGDSRYGHIFIYWEGRALSQNVLGNPRAMLWPLNYQGAIWGYLRPKFYTNASTYDASQLIKENGMATFENDTAIVIHRDTPTGSSYGTFVKGEKQVYTEKWIGNGHRWISWIHTNGVRCFAAVSGSESYGVEPWVTIGAPETKDIELIQEDGIATFIVDGVHKHYDNPSGEIFGQCNSGDEIRYYWKCVTNGHRYVVGKEGDRKFFVAVSATEDRSQMWAKFSAPDTNTKEDTKEDSKPSTEPSKPTTTDYTKNVKGYGIDVSEWNSSDIDLSKYDFVIVRVSYGEHTDKKFEYFVNKCEELKIPYGVYVYDYALNDEQARAEAEYAYNLIKDRNVQLGVWFDMEDADNYKKKAGVLTKERCSFSCKVFCDYMNAKGYYTGVYTGTNWLGTFVETTYPIWIANWGTNDGNIQSDQSSVGVIHQYAANPIDKDIIFHDIDFYKSNPKKEESKDESTDDKKDENGSENKKDEPNTNSKDDSENKINVTGINKLIELLLKIVEKIANLFK